MSDVADLAYDVIRLCRSIGERVDGAKRVCRCGRKERHKPTTDCAVVVRWTNEQRQVLARARAELERVVADLEDVGIERR